MTESQFVQWLRGFAAAANPYNLTPKQWEEVVEKLSQVRGPQEESQRWVSTSTAGNKTLLHG